MKAPNFRLMPRRAVVSVIVTCAVCAGLVCGCAEGEPNVDPRDTGNQTGEDTGVDDTGDSDSGDVPCGGCDEGVCHTESDECVGCLGDEDCSDQAVCDEESNACVQCLADSDCEGGECRDNVCAVCDSNDDCSDGTLCNEDGSACVECVGDADCSDSMVCDVETDNTCVECADDGDCGDDLMCDGEESRTCVECVDDGDCESGKCHPEFAVCAESCCNFVVESAGPQLKAHERGYGIAINADGEPVIGVADTSDDRILYMQRSGGSWSSETVDSGLDLYLQNSLEIDEGPGGGSHILLADETELMHYWRDGGNWSSVVLEDVADLEQDDSFKTTDVVVDDEGKAHMIATRYSSRTLYYYSMNTSGTRNSETVSVDPGVNVNHARMDVGPDEQPVVVASMSDGTVRVLERHTGGGWDIASLASEESNQEVDIAVDLGDRVRVGTSQFEGAMLWEPDTAGWTKTEVSQDDNRGDEIRLDFDAGGALHLIYAASSGDPDMFYARRVGEQWDEFHIDGFTQDDDYTSFVVDDEGRPHAVVRESNLQVPLTYFTTEAP